MTLTPNVVLNIKYSAPYAPGAPKTADTLFRDWVAGGGNFSYTTRKEAVEKESISEIKALKEICQNSELSEEDAKEILDGGFKSYFDYSNSRPGSTGAFDAAGDVSPERAKEIRQTLKTTQSTIWVAILSFEENYGKKYCDDKAAAFDMMKEALPALFKKSHLDYENIDWYASLHRNTDNRHLHITFWEKKPTFLQKGDTEYHYANVKKIKQEACVDFKFSVAKYFEIEALSSYKMRDSIRDNLRQNINTSDKKDILTTLLDSVKRSNSWIFAKQSEETQNKILQFALGVIDRDPILKTQYDQYINELLLQQDKYYKICKENNLPINNEIKTFADRNLRGLHVRLGNDVIAVLKQFDKDCELLQQKYNVGKKRSSNLKRLTPNDFALLEKIQSKTTGEAFKALFEGDYTTSPPLGGKLFFATEEAATLSFAFRLINYTQDKEQFQRILVASGVYSDTFDKTYNGQLNFLQGAKEIEGATSMLYKDVIFDLANNQFAKWTALPYYDNGAELRNLTNNDIQLINKIAQSRFGDDFEKIMTSPWENTQHDKTTELKGYHLHCFHLVNLISKFTQDSEQIERIAKASPLYRPFVWDSVYRNQIPFIASSERGTLYKDVIISHCVKKRLTWQTERPVKQGKQAKQGNLILSKAHQAGKGMERIVQNAFNILNSRFDNSFNQFRNAIKEQERKRKQAEGTFVNE